MRDPSAFGVASVEVHLASGPMGTVTDAHGTFRVRQFEIGRPWWQCSPL
jgi:hypothetical protein